MSTGWIKIHRQLLDWEWYDDINTSRLFIHLMITANHKDNNWRGIEIKRGSRLTSLDKLSSETSLSVSKIRTCIKKLISTNEIASKSHSQHTVFIMVNYDTYQGDDKQDNKRLANESQTNDKRLATNKNVKNVNNENKDRSSLVNDSFDYWLNIYPSSRRKNKVGCIKKYKAKCAKLTDEQIIELSNAIATDVIKRVDLLGEEIQFLPTSEPYLNQERWMDEK